MAQLISQLFRLTRTALCSVIEFLLTAACECSIQVTREYTAADVTPTAAVTASGRVRPCDS